jgi:hypothetical protein
MNPTWMDLYPAVLKASRRKPFQPAMEIPGNHILTGIISVSVDQT